MARSGSSDDLGSGRYRVLDAVSGRAVDITGISTGDGCFRLTPVHSGKCIAVGVASTAEGAGLIQWRWQGGPEQQWRLTAGSTVRRLRLSSTTNRYVRHSGFRAHLATDPYPAQDSEFRVVTGLADRPSPRTGCGPTRRAT